MNMVDQHRNLSAAVIGSARMRTVAAAAALLLIVVALWAPFGIHTNPQGDGWILKNRVANGEQWVFPQDPTRVFIYVPWTLAHFLSPDSFIGVHLLLIAVFWGKGLVLFEILRRLPGCHDGIAFLTSALAIVYPASTQLISLDAPVDRHWAVFIFLVSVLLLLVTWRRPRIPWLIGMWAAQILSLWTNEAILPLALAVPLFLFWVARQPHREFRRGAALWLIVPVLNAIHNVVHHLTVALVPERAFGRSHGVSILAIDDGWRPMAESLLIAYRKHLADCWWHSVRLLGTEVSLLVVAGLTATAVIVVGYVLWPQTGTFNRRIYRFLTVAGLLMIGLGFAPFVPTSLRFTDGRSFIVSSLGAALVLSGIAGIFFGRTGWVRTVTVGLMGLLVCLATVGVLDQRARYNGGANVQDSMLAAIIEQAPHVQPNTFFALIFVSKPGEIRRAAGFNPRNNVFEHALRHLYDEQKFRAGVVNTRGFIRYQLTEKGITRRLRSGSSLPIQDYSDSLVYRVRRNFEVSLLRNLPRRVRGPDASAYHPERLIDIQAPLPRRFRIVHRDRCQTTGR